ncbi:unnamed protein product [Litomosoides sigmodontis]|uniref:Uncharacterized protein n=1 Tax=Litomosoides sigmodontis TaxID=42156 RepID=A0A3P6TD73_LITSI|nr:unnamed protein product [Litomosoides sigmodontis]
MDFSQMIEDPRHTPGRRHGYAKEQLSQQAFTNSNQRSLISNFINTPPLVKPQINFTHCDINDTDKCYQIKSFIDYRQQKLGRNNHTSLYPSQKSAFSTYRSYANQKAPKIQVAPPPFIDHAPSDDILRPKPRYATSINRSCSKNVAELGRMEYMENDNCNKMNAIDSRNEGTAVQQRSAKVCYPELRSRALSMIAEKKVKDLPELKNFKTILNKFKIASDRALQQQKQRGRIRCGASDCKSDRGFSMPDCEQSIVAHSDDNYDNYKLTNDKMRAFTTSAPINEKNACNTLPKQWLTHVNDTYTDSDVEQPRLLITSKISSVPHALPTSSSSHMHPSRTNSLRNDHLRLHYSMCFNENFATTLVALAQLSATSSPPHPTSPRGKRGSETRDDNSTAFAIGLYKQATYELLQMTSSNLEMLQYASLNEKKFFIRRNLSISKANLQKLKLDDLIFESMIPIFSKCSTHVFNAFLPHDSFLSAAINAEPVVTQSNPVKLDLFTGNIWNPPTLVEIKAEQAEVCRILQSIPQHQCSQKYRFLIIPRHNLLTFSSFATNHQQHTAEEYEQMVCFTLLQLICALKSFQLNGIETINSDLSEFILLCRYTQTTHNIGNLDYLPRILLLQESLRTTNRKPITGLCYYGLEILSTMLNLNHNSIAHFTAPIQQCAKALQQDKSSSLTEAQKALEFGMFVGHEASQFSDEEDAQAWIDSKRADYVNYLFREVAGDSCSLNEVYERLRLQFLLSVTPQALLKMLENMKSPKTLNKTLFHVQPK